ncbi:MAG: glycosyltransferase [Bacteroidia bacterium]
MSLFIIPSLRALGGAERIVNLLSINLNVDVLAWKDLNFLAVLAQLHQSKKVITFLESSLILGFSAKYFFGSNWVHSIRNDYSFNGVKGIIYKYLLNHADLIVLTSYGQEWMVAQNQEWCVIYNPSEGYRHRIQQRTYDFISVSSLTEKKGIRELVTYWNTCDPIFRVAHIGSGPLFIEIEKLKNDNIKMFGFIDSKHIVRELLYSSKFFFLNSIKEGSPNAMLEAWDSGCFIVVKDFKFGPREYFLDLKNYNQELDLPIIDLSRGFIIYSHLNELNGLNWSKLWNEFASNIVSRPPLTQSHLNFFTEWEKVGM